jgi:hypothetical protein
MARPDPKAILHAAKSYLQRHPEELVRAVRGALGLRIGVPLDALRYFARELGGGKKMPKDIVLESAPPGLRIAMTVDAMGTALRVSLVVFIEEIRVAADEIRVGTRISDLKLQVLEGGQSPVAALVQSGALDLSKPGNLVAFIPKRPPMIVDAKDDRIVIDVMKVPKVETNARLRKLLAVATPVLGVRAIRSKDDHLDVHLRATPSGLPASIAAARG